MTRNAKIITYYIVSSLYVILAYIGYDWSFHMVPHIKGTPILNIIVDLSVYIFILLTGVGFLYSVFLVSKNKPGALRILENVFYSGLFMAGLLLVITVVLILIGRLGRLYWYELPALVLLYIPATVMFLKRKSIRA